MFSRHVTRHLVAYCDGKLSSDVAERISRHLERCSRCRAECTEIRRGLQVLGSLPLATAPASLWPKIEAALDQPSAVTTRTRYSLPGMERERPRLRLALAVTLVMILAVGIAWQHWHSRAVAFQIEALARAPGAAQGAVRGKGRLRPGQWLVTDAASEAHLDLAEMGEVDIQPNSRVGLLPSSGPQRRLSLAHGTLKAFIKAPPRLFFVATPSALAVDLGCVYTLHVDPATRNSLLQVQLGYVAFEWQGRETIVPSDAACETRPGIGPGTPYFEDASPALREALQRFDFQHGAAPMLTIVLTEARRRDGFTLWHLLRRVTPEDRPRVYRRLAQLVPPPPEATRDSVLRLDAEALDAWKDEIEDTWWE